MSKPIRIATRAIILHHNRLLMVNAWQSGSDLLCCPGGGANAHSPLPDNLIREVHEETGLTVAIGPLCLINEFHDTATDFHQIDIYFRATITAGEISDNWRDPEGIVTKRHWLTRSALAAAHFKPDSLPAVAWGDPDAPDYDALEPLIR